MPHFTASLNASKELDRLPTLHASLHQQAIRDIKAQLDDLLALELRLLNEGKRLPDFEAGRQAAYLTAFLWLTNTTYKI